MRLCVCVFECVIRNEFIVFLYKYIYRIKYDFFFLCNIHIHYPLAEFAYTWLLFFIYIECKFSTGGMRRGFSSFDNNTSWWWYSTDWGARGEGSSFAKTGRNGQLGMILLRLLAAFSTTTTVCEQVIGKFRKRKSSISLSMVRISFLG